MSNAWGHSYVFLFNPTAFCLVGEAPLARFIINIVQATSTPTATVTQVMDAPTTPCQSENLAPATVSVPPNSLPDYSSDLMNLQGINDGVNVLDDLNS